MGSPWAVQTRSPGWSTAPQKSSGALEEASLPSFSDTEFRLHLCENALDVYRSYGLHGSHKEDPVTSLPSAGARGGGSLDLVVRDPKGHSLLVVLCVILVSDEARR